MTGLLAWGRQHLLADLQLLGHLALSYPMANGVQFCVDFLQHVHRGLRGLCQGHLSTIVDGRGLVCKVSHGGFIVMSIQVAAWVSYGLEAMGFASWGASCHWGEESICRKPSAPSTPPRSARLLEPGSICHVGGSLPC